METSETHRKFQDEVAWRRFLAPDFQGNNGRRGEEVALITSFTK